jgi:hypothetical protein
MQNLRLRTATALFAIVALIVSLGTYDALARGGGGAHMGGGFRIAGGGGFHAGGGFHTGGSFHPGGHNYAHNYGRTGYGGYGCNPYLPLTNPQLCM